MVMILVLVRLISDLISIIYNSNSKLLLLKDINMMLSNCQIFINPQWIELYDLVAVL